MVLQNLTWNEDAKGKKTRGPRFEFNNVIVSSLFETIILNGGVKRFRVDDRRNATISNRACFQLNESVLVWVGRIIKLWHVKLNILLHSFIHQSIHLSIHRVSSEANSIPRFIMIAPHFGSLLFFNRKSVFAIKQILQKDRFRFFFFSLFYFNPETREGPFLFPYFILHVVFINCISIRWMIFFFIGDLFAPAWVSLENHDLASRQYVWFLIIYH